MHSFHQVRHGVFTALASQAQPVECLPYTPGIALPAHLGQPVELALVALGIHLQDGDCGRFFILVGIHPNDMPPPGVDLALVALGGIRNLALEEAFVDGGQYPS